MLLLWSRRFRRELPHSDLWIGHQHSTLDRRSSVESSHPSGCHSGWTTFPVQKKRSFAITFVPSTNTGGKDVDRPFYSRPFRIRCSDENREMDLGHNRI